MEIIPLLDVKLRASYTEKKLVYNRLLKEIAIFDEKLPFAEMGVSGALLVIGCDIRATGGLNECQYLAFNAGESVFGRSYAQISWRWRRLPLVVSTR